MTTATLPPGIHQVLATPRGRRFTKPGAAPQNQNRHTRLLAQMQDNPRVRYRQLHGELPAWMLPKEDRALRPRPETPPVPQPRTPIGAQPAPTTPRARPRSSRPPVPAPQIRPGAHRKPRRRTGWILAGYTLTATAGALASPLLGTLTGC